MNFNKVFMWTDNTTLLQRHNSTNKPPVFIHFSEILEYTSVDEGNHVALSDNSADGGTRGISAEVLQSSRRGRGSEIPHKPTNSYSNKALN